MNFDDLVAKGLVKEKYYPNTGLAVYKYAKKVFWDNLWGVDARLLEARGMVIDKLTGEVVIHPFTKVFNYGENNAGANLHDGTRLRVVQKLNGFMAAARVYKGALIVSSTGSLNSDFVVMAREHIEKLNVEEMRPEYTYLFEICDARDPHIIAEKEGAYLIGKRRMNNGKMVIEDFLDHHSYEIGAKRPDWEDMTFADLKQLVKVCSHEGYMVQSLEDYRTLFKWKSPHYLSKKFLMRMGEKKVTAMYSDPEAYKKGMDEEFQQILDWIVKTFPQDVWAALPEQDRRATIERYFEQHNAFIKEQL